MPGMEEREIRALLILDRRLLRFGGLSDPDDPASERSEVRERMDQGLNGDDPERDEADGEREG